MSGTDSSAPARAAADPAALLSFSVHDLPSPHEAAAARRTTRGRLQMLVVLGVCALPVIASYLAYFVVKPEGRSNYGALVEPRAVPAALPLADLRGAAVAPASLHGQWLLVVVAGSVCDARCERHLWLQRQLHETLGKEKDRVDKLWLVDDGMAPRPETLAAIGPSTQVLSVKRDDLARWLTPAAGRVLEDHLYIVDPHGDWMMRTPVDPEPARLKRDVDKLLRASAGWDRAGTMTSAPAWDLAPLLGIAGAGLLLALAPLLWLRWREGGRRADASTRLRALAVLTLFLTFDLVLLGAYTRLSDSGLGCPDWPGCYGQVSPLHAREAIASAEAAAPLGPVTHRKAWVEMAHRYSATAIGVLIVVLAVLTVIAARRGMARASPAWALATLAWVCMQGAFGALTVTMKLFPAIVTLHLLGGLGLLVLLAIQVERYRPVRLRLPSGLRAALLGVAALAFVQVTLGGWVSTNDAVLACRDFPTCQGAWWPETDFAQGFAVQRPLGQGTGGEALPFQALTAIHMAHRLGAYALVPALLLLGWRLSRRDPALRPWAAALAGIAVWQTASGLGNVVLGLPLVAAVAHTAGSAALAVVLAILVVRSSPRPARVAAPLPAPRTAASAS